MVSKVSMTNNSLLQVLNVSLQTVHSKILPCILCVATSLDMFEVTF